MNRLTDTAPFVLFEDARPSGGPARVFSAPRETVVAATLDQVRPALEHVRRGLQRGLHAAGWLSYEAGFAFEDRLQRSQRRSAAPLLWFGLFERAEMVSREDVATLLHDPEGAWLSPPRPRISRQAYNEAFARVQSYIAEGDVYQVNLSYRADLTLLGHPLAAYARLRGAGQGGWSGVAHDGATWLLSTSPELFFRLSAGGAIEAKPMKGTAKRNLDPELDRLAAQHLQNDPKEIAENVMIVDLLRNDISRLAKRGSVHVPALFTVETYPTLHTLTSTVRAEIRDECDAIDVLGALFPCGSITGAPKIRAMEIIDELELDGRGAYSGSIGWIAPDGSAEFNVAIRTLAIHGGAVEVGLGSAVVSDSTAENEWEECQTKGAFIKAGAAPFELIETMQCAPEHGIRYLELHLDRLCASAATFAIALDRDRARAAFELAAQQVVAPCVVRATLAMNGELTIACAPQRAFASALVSVKVVDLPVRNDDFRLRHKTSLRGFYDAARMEAGTEEVVFVDRDGFVSEGSFTNVFVERQGVLLTPPASRGLLRGVLREHLLREARAREADLRPADLRGGFLLGNAARGLTPARLSQDIKVNDLAVPVGLPG